MPHPRPLNHYNVVLCVKVLQHKVYMWLVFRTFNVRYSLYQLMATNENCLIYSVAVFSVRTEADSGNSAMQGIQTVANEDEAKSPTN